MMLLMLRVRARRGGERRMIKGAVPSCGDTNAISLERNRRKRAYDLLSRRARAPPRRSK